LRFTVIASPTLFVFVGRGNPAFATLITFSMSCLLARQLGLLRREKHAPRNDGNEKSYSSKTLKAFAP
jgi:hypothetical protein